MFSVPFRFSICLLCTPSRSKIPPPPPSILLYILSVRSFVKKRAAKGVSNYPNVRMYYILKTEGNCTRVEKYYRKNSKGLILGKLKNLKIQLWGDQISKVSMMGDSNFYGNVLSLDNVDSCTSLKSMVSWAEVNAAKWYAIQLIKFFVFSINLLSSLESMDSSLMVFKGERMKFNIIQLLNYYKI